MREKVCKISGGGWVVGIRDFLGGFLNLRRTTPERRRVITGGRTLRTLKGRGNAPPSHKGTDFVSTYFKKP